ASFLATCFDRHLHTAVQHIGLAAIEEAMIGQRLRVPFDAAVAGSEVGHLSGWLHVAILALLTGPCGGALLPFRIGSVNMDAEDDTLMAGGTVFTVVVEGQVTVL